MLFTEIIEVPTLLTSLRISSMHGIYLLAINHSTKVKKNEIFKTKTIPTYMNMLSEPDEMTLEEWGN